MSLHPRYSLLTLLVLTAIVAGGVKLWYGPHHVVEQNAKGDEEEEYTYTRDWRGSRILHGIKVERSALHDGTYNLIEIQYYENGIAMPRNCYIGPFPHRDSKSGLYWQWDDREFADASELERREWKLAIDRERGKVWMLPHYVHAWTSN